MCKTILSTLLCIMSAFAVTAKDEPTDIVKAYDSNLTLFLKDGDVEYLEAIDNLLRGGDVKCVINNSLAKEFAREKKWDVMTMHSDTYHNELINRHEKGEITSVNLTQLEWLKNWVEPRIKISNKEVPIQFVAATTNVTGAAAENSKDLFFVRGGHIVKIDDLSDSESIGRAIELYNAKDYTNAFRIFRKLAYESREAREAQYYYTVMLIKGQGCGEMNKKVRDYEAAWLGLAGFKAAYDDLSNLANKFSMSIYGFNFEQIWLSRPSYNGKRIVREKNKFGIMADNGRMIKDYTEGFCLQFSGDGYTSVTVDGNNWGIMDSDGNQIIPYDYSNILPVMVDGKFMAIKDNKLMVISKTGVPLKIIDGEFLSIPFALDGNRVLVGSKDKSEIYDFEGNLIDDTFHELTLNYTTGLINLKKKDEDKPYATYHIKW